MNRLPTGRLGASLRPAVGFMLAAALAAGCGGDTGLNDHAKAEAEKKQKTDSLSSTGAKITHGSSQMGEYAIVDLSGQTITDDTVKKLIDLDRIGVLNLSKSSVTDAQMAAMHKGGVTKSLNKLDLSKTEVTDATVDLLPGCKLLGELNLSGSKATKTGAEKFKQTRAADANVGPMFKNTRITL